MGKPEGMRYVEKVGRIMHLVLKTACPSGWLSGLHVLNGNGMDGWGPWARAWEQIVASVGYGYSGSPFHRQIRAII